MLAAVLVAISAAITLLLGGAHLYLTFFTRAFSPREATLEEKLKTVSPVLTSETTLWRSQVGFHVSHSLGIILFGAVFGYLALEHSTFFFQSRFLVALGAVFLLGYLVLAKLYWFSRPFIGVALALGLYLAGIVAAYV
jgi:hypothetical protein